MLEPLTDAAGTVLSVLQIGGLDGQSFAFEQISPEVVQLGLAVLLGMFLGLEREWSEKNAGIRTFALLTLLGAILSITGEPLLLVAGALLVITMSVLLAVQSLLSSASEASLSLTTSASMFVAYGVGILVTQGFLIESVTIAVLSSLLLVLKRELHEFAWGLSKEEMQSATEFAILAFVVYPLLPDEAFGPWNAIEPRTVWLLVIAVSGIGLVNYVLVKRYRGRGFIATGFFGGLVNSTAVIAEMAQRAKQQPSLRSLAVGAILISNAAMAFRNALVVVPFMPETALIVGVPLGAITVTGIGLSLFVSDLDQDFEAQLTSPFSLRNALVFGGLFLAVLVVSAGAEATFGANGFLTTSFLAGLISSGTATATAVTLVATDQISSDLAIAGVIAGTLASILVKVVFAATIDWDLVRPVMIWNVVLIAVGVFFGGIVILFL
ncbi:MULTISPECIES: MgtC/SapB family protein [Halomicrobium]|uniref:Magnesium transporter accessory protein n=1 Tax=Halomicrobium mukohataei (strain ATCC 700874 / DSM 12286 / JCM 9738 / NCIMB 13541) TaxID=485914 RepID=C7NXN2_HALMD|nr:MULTISPECIES: MgtC/SapB family protein [Halomicrobium]ACV46470.1 magnesium transporter accessory protein [Halomicrobium mukohataei DSM 12286]